MGRDVERVLVRKMQALEGVTFEIDCG
jgi:hypothetical protein